MISVIVPIYNVEKYINRCIDSIISQTYKDIEIILVDDDSPDDCPKICDEYAKKDKRIKVIHKKNGGVSSARNDGIKIAKGEYICFVDSDDWLEKDFIETLHDNIINNNAQLSVCNFINEPVDINKEKSECSIYVYNDNNIYYEILNNSSIGGYLCNKMFAKKYITEYLNENLSQCEDLLFVVKYIRNIKKMVFIEKPLYHYVRSFDFNDNIENTRSRSLMSAYTYITDEFQKCCPEYLNNAKINTLKIFLNFRAVYIKTKLNNTDLKTEIDYGIKKYFSEILSNKKVNIKYKLNIILTYLFPVKMLEYKRKILTERRKKGIWD